MTVCDITFQVLLIGYDEDCNGHVATQLWSVWAAVWSRLRAILGESVSTDLERFKCDGVLLKLVVPVRLMGVGQELLVGR